MKKERKSVIEWQKNTDEEMLGNGDTDGRKRVGLMKSIKIEGQSVENGEILKQLKVCDHFRLCGRGEQRYV